MKRYIHCTNHSILWYYTPSCCISDFHRKGSKWRWVDGTFLVHSNIGSLVGLGIVILYLNCSKNYPVNKSDQNIVGVNLSLPHLVELLDEMSLCVYLTLCRKLLAALVVHNVLIQKRFPRGEDTDHEQLTSSMALFLVLLPES